MSEHQSSSLPDELISGYLDDVLPEPQRDEVERWLERDEDARRLLDDFRALRESLQELPPPQVPPGLESSILQKIGMAPASEPAPVDRAKSPASTGDHRFDWKRGIMWAGLALTASVLVMMYQPRETASPTDVSVASNPAENVQVERESVTEETDEDLVRGKQADQVAMDDGVADFSDADSPNTLSLPPGKASVQTRGAAPAVPSIENRVEGTATRSASPQLRPTVPATRERSHEVPNADRTRQTVPNVPTRQQPTTTAVPRPQALEVVNPPAAIDRSLAETADFPTRVQAKVADSGPTNVAMIVVEVDPDEWTRLQNEVQQRFQGGPAFQTTTLTRERPAAPGAGLPAPSDASDASEPDDAPSQTTRLFASDGAEVSWIVLPSSKAEVEQLLQRVNVDRYVIEDVAPNIDTRPDGSRETATADDLERRSRLRRLSRRFQSELSAENFSFGSTNNDTNVTLTEAQSPILLIATPAPQPAADTEPAADVPPP